MSSPASWPAAGSGVRAASQAVMRAFAHCSPPGAPTGTGFDARVGPQPCSARPEPVRSHPPTEASVASGPWGRRARPSRCQESSPHRRGTLRACPGARRETRVRRVGARDPRGVRAEVGDPVIDEGAGRCQGGWCQGTAGNGAPSATPRPLRPRGRPASCGIAREVNNPRGDTPPRGLSPGPGRRRLRRSAGRARPATARLRISRSTSCLLSRVTAARPGSCSS